MSDDEYETTNVHVAKPKKERTPAQKAATARALEALAAAREAKKAEREAAAAPRPRAAARPAAPRTERNVLTYEDEEPAPRPRARAPEPKDYGEDIRSLSEGLHSVISYIEKKETKKKKPAPKPKRLPSPSSSEDELEPEPEPEPRKKQKMTKSAPPTPDYRLNHSNPQDVLRNIFWRNM